jgi:hypothetical protein
MKRATGLSLTNAVRSFTGKPKLADRVSTLLSALVACIRNVSELCTGCLFRGVMRTPILVGAKRAYL